MTTQPQPEALRLADDADHFAGWLERRSLPTEDVRKYAAELRRLHAECEALRKSLALVQQHHATAWNRGHTMGMAANRQIAREAQEAVARDAWGNTQLTEALLAAEAECEAVRADAERYRWLRDIATDADWMFVRETPVKETDAAIDAARAAKGNQ